MSIDALRKRLKQAVYSSPDASSAEPRINDIVAKLKNDPKYKNCSEEELRTIALYQIHTNFLKNNANDLRTLLDSTGKPWDPIWSQFTYEEILEMAAAGVNVPDEFLDWANSMADADTTSYEIEDNASLDANTVANLETKTNDSTQIAQQRKLQVFASKAEKQDALLINKKIEVQEQAFNLNSAQTELEAKQSLTLNKIDKISEEFNRLNQKVKSGEPLTEAEIRRYKELGMLLNIQGQELVTQSKNVEADLKDLMSQMGDVSSLLNVNNEIGKVIDTLGILYAGQEGGKNSVYIKGLVGGHSFGDMASYAYAAQSHSIALSAGTIGVNLNVNSNELQFMLNANAAVADLTLNRIRGVNSVVSEVPVVVPVNSENPDDNTKPVDKPDDTEPVDGTEPVNEPTVPEPVDGTEPVNEPAVPEPVDGTEPVDEPAAPEPVDGTEPIDETDETEGVEGTEPVDETDVTEPVEEVSPLEAAAREYLEGCVSRSTEMQVSVDNVISLKNEVKSLRKSRLNDILKATSQFNSAFKQYSNLLDKVKRGKEFSNADKSEFLRLNAILDSDNGSIATDMQGKIAILDGFTDAVEQLGTLSNENAEYGAAAVQSGIDYAKEEVGDIELPSIIEKSKKYDILYGKSGETVSRNVIDNGETLIKEAKSANKILASNGKYVKFADKYSSQLNGMLELNAEKTEPLTQEFNNLLASKGQNQEKESRESRSTAPTQEKATADDVNNVKNTGKKAEDQAKDAEKKDKAAVKDKKDADKEIRVQQALMKANTALINRLTQNTNDANAQILELSAQAELEVAEIEAMTTSLNTENATLAAPETRGLNSAVTTNTSNSNADTVSALEGKVVTLGTIAQHSQQLGQRITSNGRTINVLERNSVKADKKLSTAAKAKYQQAVEEQKTKEKEIKDNEKLTKTVGYIGQVFTVTKLAGMALMLFPWGVAAGTIMFTVGKYGEIASYTTNAAINVAQGNLLGAAINIGAAALSFLSAPPASSAATQGVKEGAKAGAEAAAQGTSNAAANGGAVVAGQELGKNVGQGVGQGVGTEVIKETGGEAVKGAGSEALKDAGTEVVKNAGTETTQAAAQNTLAQLPAVQAPVLNTSVNVTQEMIEASFRGISENMSKQLAAEGAKNLLKENAKVILKNTLVEAGQATLTQVGGKLQQKDTKEEKKRKVLVRFERKKRDALKRGIEKIKKTYNLK